MALGSIFLSTILLSFSVSLLVMGLFGAYFGKGRSRSIGFVLSLAAIMCLGLFAALTFDLVPSVSPVFDPVIVGQSLLAVVAALVGALLAGLFFVATMVRS